MSDDDFLTAFERCHIARKDWTHEAHVRVAWLYLTRVPADEDVFDRVRIGIKKLNSALAQRQQMSCIRRFPKAGEKETRGTGGYHETITVAFVTVIASRIVPGEDFPTFRDRNPDLFDRTLPALLKHYSPELLSSALPRAEFVEPDPEPLPEKAAIAP